MRVLLLWAKKGDEFATRRQRLTLIANPVPIQVRRLKLLILLSLCSLSFFGFSSPVVTHIQEMYVGEAFFVGISRKGDLTWVG